MSTAVELAGRTPAAQQKQRSSTTRIGASMFFDDERVKVGSRGQLFPAPEDEVKEAVGRLLEQEDLGLGAAMPGAEDPGMGMDPGFDAEPDMGLEDVPARDALLARALLAVPGDAVVCPPRAGGTV